MAKNKTKVVEQAVDAEVLTADDLLLPVGDGPMLLLGSFDLGLTLADIEVQTAAFRARQQAVLAQLATATGIELADMLFLFGLSTSDAVVR